MGLEWYEWAIGLAGAIAGIWRGILAPHRYRVKGTHAIVTGGVIGVFATLIAAFFAGRWISNR